MGGNYQKGMYNQLMEVMARLDAVENRDDNAHLKSIINNDSSNTSLPPSSDQKSGKPSNTFNGKGKHNAGQADRKTIKEAR